MNKDRRKEIARIAAEIDGLETLRDQLRDDIQSVLDEEQDYYETMPESFQNGDKGCAAQEAIDNLQSALDALENFDAAEVRSGLENASA